MFSKLLQMLGGIVFYWQHNSLQIINIGLIFDQIRVFLFFMIAIILIYPYSIITLISHFYCIYIYYDFSLF